jgi:hypothetical protein
MAQPSYPTQQTLSAIANFPNPKMVIRSRREFSTRDTVNARQFEHWQTDGKYDVYNRPDNYKTPPFYDSMPSDSRMNTMNYSGQPRFDENGEKGGQNTFFDKYATSFDPRNTIRELRGAIYEDKNTDYIRESEHLLTRNFDNRWVNVNEIKQNVEAAESLRVKMDDIRITYK